MSLKVFSNFTIPLFFYLYYWQKLLPSGLPKSCHIITTWQKWSTNMGRHRDLHGFSWILLFISTMKMRQRECPKGSAQPCRMWSLLMNTWKYFSKVMDFSELNKSIQSRSDFRCGFLHSRLFSRAFILFLYHSFFLLLSFMLFLPSSLIYCSKLKILFLHNLHRNCSITKNKGVTQRAKWTILAVTGTVFAFWHCFLTFFVNSLLLWWP